MRVLGIDPGPEQSGWCMLNGDKIEEQGICENRKMIYLFDRLNADWVGIEMIASYGIAAGRSVFETCVWIGRFQQAWYLPEAVRLVYRKDAKIAVCGTHKAGDAQVREALIDRYGPQGTKRAPGPTYGIKSHAWSALAIATTVADSITPSKERRSAKR